MMRSNLTCMFLALALLSACGVKSRQVENQPPRMDIPADIVSHYGRVVPQDISLFFWPNWSEAEAEQKTAAIRRASTLIDDVKISGALKDQLGKAFNEKCSAVVAPSAVSANPEDEVPLRPEHEIPVPMREGYQKCKTMQKMRLAASSKLKANEKTYPEALGTIQNTIGAENFRPINAAESSLVIEESGPSPRVELSLAADFVKSGFQFSTDATDKSQKIENAKYDPATRVLSFSFPDPSPELFTDGSPKSHLYSFALVRVDDLMKDPENNQQLVRFTGDMVLVRLEKGKDPIYVRRGSAQITGLLR